MRFGSYQVSRKGGREKNEDRMGYCYTRDSGLFALADGMGEQPRVARVAIPHPVFVLLAAALAADLVRSESHDRFLRGASGVETRHGLAPDFRFSICSLSRSEKLSVV